MTQLQNKDPRSFRNESFMIAHTRICESQTNSFIVGMVLLFQYTNQLTAFLIGFRFLSDFFFIFQKKKGC